MDTLRLGEEDTMPRSRPPYSPEYRQQMVDLVRGGRTPDSLSREFEPTAQSIWNWIRQAERDEGTRTDGLTTEEKEELRRLRRENRVCTGSRPTLGGGHPVRADVGGVPVSGGGGRCVESTGRRLGDGESSAHRARAGRAQHGAGTAAGDRCDPPLGPGLPGWIQAVVATSRQ